MVVIVVEFCTLIKLFIVLKLLFLIVCRFPPKFCKFLIVFLELCITVCYSKLLEQSAAGMNVIGSFEVSSLPVGLLCIHNTNSG